MARITNKKLNKFIEEGVYQELLREFKNINSRGDLDNFFNKFMTSGEKNLIFRRMAVIKLIKQGKKYREIKKILDVSSNTISNVRDILEGRGYSKNPNRKKVYSTIKIKGSKKSGPRSIFPKYYKGVKSII